MRNRKLSLAVREVVMAERERKIREREEWRQIRSYHENIMKKGTFDEYIHPAPGGGVNGKAHPHHTTPSHGLMG